MSQPLEPKLLYVRVTFWNGRNRPGSPPLQTTVEGWMRECQEGIDREGNRFTLEMPAIEIHPGFVFDPNGWMWGILLSDVIALVPAKLPDAPEGEGESCPPTPADNA